MKPRMRLMRSVAQLRHKNRYEAKGKGEWWKKVDARPHYSTNWHNSRGAECLHFQVQLSRLISARSYSMILNIATLLRNVIIKRGSLRYLPFSNLRHSNIFGFILCGNFQIQIQSV